MVRSFSSRGIASVFGLLVTLPAVAATPGPDPVEKAAAALKATQIEIGNLESALAVMGESIRHLTAETRYFPIERRLLDADLLFETGDYGQAAILYRDLLENPSFRGQPGYFKVVFKLAESLFQTKNYVPSRHYFRMAAVPEAGPDYPVAVARLFEIAVIRRDFSGCERLEPLVASLAEHSPDVLYSYGKYLYHLGRTLEAEENLARVPPGASSFSRARYFLGVLAVKSQRLEAALDQFVAAGSQPASGPGDVDVQGLAYLSRARILASLERFDEALEALRAVPVTSSVYPESLFDAAWISVQRGDSESAIHALDILALTQPTGDLALRASALRGRVLARADDPALALEAYEGISSDLTPLAADLDRLSQNPSGLVAFFEWVTANQAEKLRLEVPVGDRAATWLQTDPDMVTLIAMFRDLAAESEGLAAGIEMADRLLWTLRSEGKIVSFPVLKDHILRLKETENRFLSAAVSALDGAKAAFTGRLVGEAGARYQAALQARGLAEREMARIPRSYEAFIERERDVLSRYREIERDLFLVGSVLDMQVGQVLAVEDWLREARARGDPTLTEKREADVRATLNQEKRHLEAIRGDIARLRETLQRETVKVESQTELLSDDDARRSALWKALLDEARALETATQSLQGGLGELGRDTARLVFRASEGSGRVAPLVGAVHEIAERGAAEIEAIVVRERQRLQAALAELQKTDLDIQAFARTDGMDVFRRISARLKDVLLEAEVGLVDMSWERAQKLSESLRKLGLERAEKVRTLGRIEEMVRLGPGTQEAPTGEK